MQDDTSDLFAREWMVPWHAHVVPLVMAAAMGLIWLLVPLDVLTAKWALSSSALNHGRIGPVVLHLFAHGGLPHILMNLVAILLLSGPIISRLGNPPLSWLRFLYLFLGSGLCGAVMFLILNQDDNASMLGASGAIFGLLGALARVHPATGEAVPIKSPRTRAVIKVFVHNHIALFVIIAVVAVVTGKSTLVAWEAHLGGLLFGFFATPLYLPRSRGRLG